MFTEENIFLIDKVMVDAVINDHMYCVDPVIQWSWSSIVICLNCCLSLDGQRIGSQR